MSQINLKKNIAFTTSSQVITMAAAFVSNWFLARFLGPELRGQYVYLFTINSVVWMLLDLGISKSMMFCLQHDKADPRKLYSYIVVFFGISLALSILLFQLFGTRLLGQKGFTYPQLMILGLSVYIVAFQLFSRQKFLLIGLNHIRDYATINFLPTVAYTLLLLPLFWLFPSGDRIQGSYLLSVGVLLSVIIVYHFRIIHKISFRFLWDWALVIRAYALGFKAFLSEYLIILMTRTDILVLKQLGSFAQLGVYTLAINFVEMINITAGMIGVVLLNKFSALKNDTASLIIMRKIFIVMLAFDLVCILGMVVVGLPIIKFLYGVQYQEAWLVFIYLIPAIIGLTLGGLFNTFLWSKGFPVFTIFAPFIASAGKVVLGYLFIPRFGMMGAAISSSIVYPLWFVLLLTWYFLTHKEQKISQLLMRWEDFTQITEMLLAIRDKALGKV